MARKKTAEQPQGDQPEQQPEQTEQPEPEQAQGEQPEQQPEQTQQPEPDQSQGEQPEQQPEQTQQPEPDQPQSEQQEQQPQQPVELKSFVMVQHMAGIDLDWPIGSEHMLPVDQADRLINAKIAKAKE